MTLKQKFFNMIIEEHLDDYDWIFKMPLETFMKKRLKWTILMSTCYSVIMFTLLYITNQELPLYLISYVIILWLAYKYPYFNLKKKAKKLKTEVSAAFPIWIGQLEVLLVNHNIPNSLLLSEKTAPSVLQGDIHKLVQRTQSNPTDKQAYKRFLAIYKLPDIQEITMDLYQFNYMNKDDIILEFKALHERLNEIESDCRKSRNQIELDLIDFGNSAPCLIGCIYILITSMMISNVLMNF